MLPHWTEDDVLVNGNTIHYTRTGQGEKPALVLAHGFSDAGLCYLPVARDLESEYDIILIDARGHGRSQRVAPGDILDHAADLAGLIQALDLKDPVVGGHSMGAGSTATLAARHPGLARALILEDPGWRDHTPPPAAEEGTEPPRNPWFEWLRSLPDLTLEQVMAKCRADSPTWAEIEIAPWAESKKQFDLHVLETGGTWLDWRDQARGITVPALLLTADPQKGAIVTPEGAAEAQALSPHIRVVNIPGAGHNIRRENYPAFMKAVREFLSGL
jgi:pimeloyl-ACP methyl ester carboxylesterase